MKKNKNILVGVAQDGKGGVDSYILSFVSVANAQGYKCDVLTTKPSSEYKNKLNNLNANLIETPSLHKKQEIFQHIDNLYKEKNYQAAYWNISTSLMYPYVKAAKKCEISKNIVHSHAANNDKNNPIINYLFDNLHKVNKNIILKYSDIYAACSKNAARWMFGNKVADNNQYIFVPNPIETKKCQYKDSVRTKIRKELKIDNKYVVGCVSSFRPHKNMLHLIDVFKNVYIKNAEAFLLVCAGGPYKEKFETHAKRELKKGSYKFLGHVENVQEILQAFDIFVFPSKIEGFGMALVEAQAADLDCVIGSGIPNEAIVVKENCHQLNNYIPDSWSKLILKLSKSNRDRNESTFKLIDEAGFNPSSPKIIVDLLN